MYPGQFDIFYDMFTTQQVFTNSKVTRYLTELAEYEKKKPFQISERKRTIHWKKHYTDLYVTWKVEHVCQVHLLVLQTHTTRKTGVVIPKVHVLGTYSHHIPLSDIRSRRQRCTRCTWSTDHTTAIKQAVLPSLPTLKLSLQHHHFIPCKHYNILTF